MSLPAKRPKYHPDDPEYCDFCPNSYARFVCPRTGKWMCRPCVDKSEIYVENGETTFTIRIHPFNTIREVKAIIEAKEGIPCAQQRLLYKFDELDDELIVRDSDELDDDLIVRDSEMPLWNCRLRLVLRNV